MESFRFQSDAPILKYCQKPLNSCYFSSLSPAFASIKHNKTDNAISLRIEESLENEVGNRIDFANAILKNAENLNVNQECIIAWENTRRREVMIL